MKRITIREYGKIYPSDDSEKSSERELIPTNLFRKLQSFDTKQAKAKSDYIFDWENPKFAKAKSYVGFIQIPGLQIEILPKVDDLLEENFSQSRENLTYMLSLSKQIPIKERDLAHFNFEKYNLPEILIRVFVDNLTQELHRGIERSYIEIEGNLPYIKGKLLIYEQIKLNSVNKANFYLHYDELIEDNMLNRILKASAHQLLFLTKSSVLQTNLRNIIQLFDNVRNIYPEHHHFNKIQFTRNSQRYEPLIDFCELVFAGRSPKYDRGEVRTYSLLFPMEKLFEEFISQYIYRYAEKLGLERKTMHIQARGKRKWLLRDESSHQVKFQLKPDLLFKSRDKDPHLIIDTKWKNLSKSGVFSFKNVASSDLYQLYAYANRYNCQDNVLLYPQTEGTNNKAFAIEGSNGKKIRIEFINLSRNIRKNDLEFMTDLKGILHNHKGLDAENNGIDSRN